MDSHARLVLRIRLASIAPQVAAYMAGIEDEKARKRQMQKVRTNALRLKTAIDELDEDAREYVAYCMAGGATSAPRDARRRSQELRSGPQLLEMLKRLERIAAADQRKLPAQEVKVRPEFWIAGPIVEALADAGIPVTASDTGPAADCFRAVAAEAGIEISESPRYWINLAKAEK